MIAFIAEELLVLLAKYYFDVLGKNFTFAKKGL